MRHTASKTTKTYTNPAEVYDSSVLDIMAQASVRKCNTVDFDLGMKKRAERVAGWRCLGKR